HLVYRYQSDTSALNGRFVEVQFRTHLQHVWATAVEMVDLFEQQRLKSGNGDPTWTRFFALMSSVIASVENSPLVPNTSDQPAELANEIKQLAQALSVERRMEAYRTLANRIPDSPNATVSGVSGVSGYSGSNRPAY